MAAAAQAAPMLMLSLGCTSSSAPLRAGTPACTAATKAANSSGSSTPAVSHSVTRVAPHSSAAAMAWHRKSFSARVASTAVNSTYSHSPRAAFTWARTASSMAGAFL